MVIIWFFLVCVFLIDFKLLINDWVLNIKWVWSGRQTNSNKLMKWNTNMKSKKRIPINFVNLSLSWCFKMKQKQPYTFQCVVIQGCFLMLFEKPRGYSSEKRPDFSFSLFGEEKTNPIRGTLALRIKLVFCSLSRGKNWCRDLNFRDKIKCKPFHYSFSLVVILMTPSFAFLPYSFTALFPFSTSMVSISSWFKDLKASFFWIFPSMT